MSKNVKAIVADMLSGFLIENGYALYNVEFVKEGKERFLRVYIEKPDDSYISTEDCELVSRWLSERLDEADPIEEAYYLEVSSPGLDRPLLRDEDYARFAGRQVDVSLYKPLNGAKQLTGRLQGLTEGSILIETEDGNTVRIKKEEAAKVKLAVIF